jgi:hypothetical protein
MASKGDSDPHVLYEQHYTRLPAERTTFFGYVKINSLQGKMGEMRAVVLDEQL